MTAVVAVTVFALLLARVVRAPRGAWRPILAAAGLALAASRLWPEGAAYRVEVAEAARVGFWLGLAAIPVGFYALWVRALRRRAGSAAPPPPSRPRGLVQFDADAGLAAETAAALAAEAPGERLSLGWRGADAGLEGHVRLRVADETAEIEMIRVAPEARRRGLGGALLRAAEAEATARGARRIGAAVGAWQAPGFFAACGYAAPAGQGGPTAGARAWMEKTL